jgi:hypothetical protein
MVFRGMLVVLAALACKGEPKRSYCEALCDWAVVCNATERPIDEEASLEACLQATRESDASCDRAETGKIDPASAKLLEPCVKAIDANAAEQDCNGWVGSIDDLKVATVPAECSTQADDAIQTFQVARDTTQESNEQLCTRFTETFCNRAEACLLGDYELPQEAIQAAGGTPAEICIEKLDAALTSKCVSSGLYDPEEDLTDANLARQGARECLRDFDSIQCSAILDPSIDTLSPTCAAAFSSPEDIAAAGGALFDVSEIFAEYIP